MTEKISSDIFFIADEIYPMQEAQYSGGSYISVNEGGDHYWVVVAFMRSGQKETVPILIRFSTETTIKGQWLAQEFAICISQLIEDGIKVWGKVTDNHSINVKTFKTLISKSHSDTQHFFVAPRAENNHFLLFYSVDLMGNIMSNLLGSGKIVFRLFGFNVLFKILDLRARIYMLIWPQANAQHR